MWATFFDLGLLLIVTHNYVTRIEKLDCDCLIHVNECHKCFVFRCEKMGLYGLMNVLQVVILIIYTYEYAIVPFLETEERICKFKSD